MESDGYLRESQIEIVSGESNNCRAQGRAGELKEDNTITTMNQDWDTVTLSKKKGGSNGKKYREPTGDKAVTAAQRSGATVASEKKYAAGSNKVRGAEKKTGKLKARCY